MSIDNILHDWYRIRKDIKRLREQEDQIKNLLHDMMNIQGVNCLAGVHYECNRSVRTRRSILKDTISKDDWLELSTATRFPVITVKKL